VNRKNLLGNEKTNKHNRGLLRSEKKDERILKNDRDGLGGGKWSVCFRPAGRHGGGRWGKTKRQRSNEVDRNVKKRSAYWKRRAGAFPIEDINDKLKGRKGRSGGNPDKKGRGKGNC